MTMGGRDELFRCGNAAGWLVVGMIMAFLGVTPRDVLGYVTGFANEAMNNAAAWAGSAISYVLLGAVIVIPIWLLSVLFKTFNRR
jgi:hypothetical protein